MAAVSESRNAVEESLRLVAAVELALPEYSPAEYLAWVAVVDSGSEAAEAVSDQLAEQP